MPCTLRKFEVWQVSPRSCARCTKTPLPWSVKSAQHQACDILAESNALSHKVCLRRQVQLERKNRKNSFKKPAVGKAFDDRFQKSKPKIKIKIHSSKKITKTKNNLRKKMSSSGEYESDSDSSVIILSDDEDENPFQWDIDKKSGATNGDILVKSTSTSKINDEEKKSLKYDKFEVDDEKSETCNLLEKSRDINHVNGQNDSKLGGEDIDDDEDLFEKNYQHDFNFVHAKFLVKKKVGFVCDVNSNLDPVEKRVRKLLEHADIMIMKKFLDIGGEEVLPSCQDKKIMPSKPKPKPTPKTVATRIVQPPSQIIQDKSPVDNDEFSDDDSSNKSKDVNLESASVPQMPVVEIGDMEVPETVKKKKEKEEFNFNQYNPPKRNQEKLRPTPKLLRPAVIFPSIKGKSFKIPRAAKARIPRWVTNGSLWQWALTVDDNGQYSRTVGTRSKVPWASMVTKRPCCEEYQDWLVRGTYSEGDTCRWEEEEIKMKSRNEKTQQMREEMMWRERMFDKLLGKVPQSKGLPSARDPLGLDEKDSGTGTLEAGNLTYDEGSVRDTLEELSENELNVSDQSLVTHVRTPTHTFCVDEDEANEGAKQEVGDSAVYVDYNMNNAEIMRNSPHQLNEVVHPFPSPPPSKVPSSGFVFSRAAASDSSAASEAPGVRKCPSAGASRPVTADSSEGSRAAPAGDQSVLSMLITGNSARLKLF